MSGRAKANLTGGRVAGQPTFTPSYLRAGETKPIPAKCDVNVLVNVRTKVHTFKITGWGKMAEIMARGCAVGKELTIAGRLDSYRGRVWTPPDAAGNINYIQAADGTPLLITKTGITVEDIHFGADSKKTIQEEIQAGLRPLSFAVPGSQDEQAWIQICNQKNAEIYVQGSVAFGYAKVRVIEGTTPVAATVANNAGTAQFAQNVQSQQVNPPVMVAGQNMGYSVAAPNAAPPAQPVMVNAGAQPVV